MSKENEVPCTNNGNLLMSLIDYKIVNDGSRNEYTSVTLVFSYFVGREWEQAPIRFKSFF